MKKFSDYLSEWNTIAANASKEGKSIVKFPIWVWVNWSQDNNIQNPMEEVKHFKQLILQDEPNIWCAVAWVYIMFHDVEGKTLPVYTYLAENGDINLIRAEVQGMFGTF